MFKILRKLFKEENYKVDILYQNYLISYLNTLSIQEKGFDYFQSQFLPNDLIYLESICIEVISDFENIKEEYLKIIKNDINFSIKESFSEFITFIEIEKETKIQKVFCFIGLNVSEKEENEDTINYIAKLIYDETNDITFSKKSIIKNFMYLGELSDNNIKNDCVISKNCLKINNKYFINRNIVFGSQISNFHFVIQNKKHKHKQN